MFVEATSDLYQRGYLHSAMHIGNDKRMKIEHQNLEAGSVWTAWAMIQGSQSFVGFLESEIPELLNRFCLSFGFLTLDEAKNQGIGEVFGCHLGQPTDYFVRAMYKSEGATLTPGNLQIDLGNIGMLCCLPILPAKADDIADAIEILDSIDRDFGIIPAATLNPLQDLYLESVINIYFDRTDPAAVLRAHEANAEMHRRFYADGYRFYRFDIETMKSYVDAENPHFKLVDVIKTALDPNRILSPGRYEPAR
jgi:4-cresol dehydrogenase (hydroxylating)